MSYEVWALTIKKPKTTKPGEVKEMKWIIVILRLAFLAICVLTSFTMMKLLADPSSYATPTLKILAALCCVGVILLLKAKKKKATEVRIPKHGTDANPEYGIADLRFFHEGEEHEEGLEQEGEEHEEGLKQEELATSVVSQRAKEREYESYSTATLEPTPFQKLLGWIAEEVFGMTPWYKEQGLEMVLHRRKRILMLAIMIPIKMVVASVCCVVGATMIWLSLNEAMYATPMLKILTIVSCGIGSALVLYRMLSNQSKIEEPEVKAEEPEIEAPAEIEEKVIVDPALMAESSEEVKPPISNGGRGADLLDFPFYDGDHGSDDQAYLDEFAKFDDACEEPPPLPEDDEDEAKTPTN